MSYITASTRNLIGIKTLARQQGLSGQCLGDGTSLNYLPPGTQLVYNVSWGSGGLAWDTPSDIAASLAQDISENAGINMIGTNAQGGGLLENPTTFSATLQLAQEYTNAQMVQSVLDSAMEGMGYSPISNITVTSIPAGTSVLASAAISSAPIGAVPGAPVVPVAPTVPTSALQFVETYGGWIAAAVIGGFLIKELI